MYVVTHRECICRGGGWDTGWPHIQIGGELTGIWGRHDDSARDPTGLRRHGYLPIPTIGKVPPFSRWQKIGNVWHSMLGHGAKTCRARATPEFSPRSRQRSTSMFSTSRPPSPLKNWYRDRFEGRGCILPRIGKPPKHAIPFRTTDPFAKITANLVAADGSTGEKIEFMCDGQQVVVAGIHPGTGKPYSWPLGNLTDIARDDLPD